MEHDVSRRRAILSVALSAVVVALVAAVTPAGAMVRAAPDTARRAVGSFWVVAPDGRAFDICTGTLVSPAVFLTASHCVAVLLRFGWASAVSFADRLPADGSAPADLRTVTPVLNPRYRPTNGTDSYRFDVSLLLLDEPVHGVAYGQLPPAGLLDSLQRAGTLRSQTFTVVGYGTERQVVVPRVGPTFPATGERRSGTLGFLALDRSMLHQNQRANAGFAGACYGDSGGPSFLGTSDVIVAVTSTGDMPCGATNVAYRLDTPDARAFLGRYLPLP
jgi:hypothetical protein